ncbi:MAG: efflux transporter outer membrane subunit [Alphaproteobacteria bacterium]|nr:efflux transporter outer membrane subunit [Alphaproteobacteria bacterium]
MTPSRPIRAAGLGLVLSTIAGCTVVGPDFERPQAPTTETWIDADEAGDKDKVDPRDEPVTEWWTLFDDPVLNDLIETAYAQNLTLRTAGIRIFAARAQLGIVVGEQYPQQQSVGTDFKHEKISENVGILREISSVVPLNDTFSRWQLGFDAGWELDIWGQFRRGIEAADANLVAQIANYDDVIVTLTGDVAGTYVNIRTIEQRLVDAHENVKLQEEGLRIARARFRNGVATELDVDEATTLLNNTRATIPQLEIALRQSKNALSVLLGMPPGDLGRILVEPGTIPVPPPDVGVGVPADLLRRRPDIRAAELQAAAQSAQIGIAEADLYPAFTLSGSVGFEASDFAELFTGNSFTGFINPGVSWNIFNYGRIKNNVRVQDAVFQELLVNYQNTVLNAYLEVENALVAFLQAQRQAQYLAVSAAAAAHSVGLALLQYQEGTADYTRVLNTQNALVNAQDRLTATKGEIVANLIAVYKALGGGWQIRAGHPFLPEATKEEMRRRTDWGDILGPQAIPEMDESLDPPPSPEPPTFFTRTPDW